jgi:hypothetical protein
LPTNTQDPFMQHTNPDQQQGAAAAATTDPQQSASLPIRKCSKGMELKRDMESILCFNQAKAAGDGVTVSRKLASVLSWIKTNTSKNAVSAFTRVHTPSKTGANALSARQARP